MSFSKLFFLLLVLSVFSVPLLVYGVFGLDGEDVATSAIERAEMAMVSAHEVVLDAEEAGADVSGLLDTLSVGGEYLAEANLWFRLGDFESASRLADLCYGVVVGVGSEAVALKNEAQVLWVNNLVLRLVGSMVGVVVVLFLSFVVWRAFRRRYCKRVLGLRPEVVSSES